MDEQKSIIAFETKRGVGDYVAQFVESETLARASMIAETSRERIKKIIADNITLSEEDLRNMIVDAENGSIAAWRAAMIARTEVHLAQVSGTHKAAVVAQADGGLEYDKEWVSAIDSRTRDDHTDADGQIVALDADFVVGGEKIQTPGRGSAKNSVNCRCVVIYNARI